jgi:hypothetical protein
MIRKIASTIQEDLSLALNRVCGRKGGPVVEENGMLRDVLMEFIEVIQKMHKSNFVWIMEILIQSSNIQTHSVVNHSFIRNLIRKEKKEMMNPAFITVDILVMLMLKHKKVNGHAVALKREMVNHVLRISISIMIGLKKKPKNISLIDHWKTHQMLGKISNRNLILSFMVVFQDFSDLQLLMYQKILQDLLN